MMERYLARTGPHPGAQYDMGRNNSGSSQDIYRFPNGYGASVIRFWGSNGYDAGLYELCVLKFKGRSFTDFLLDHNTYLSDDVIGRLTEDDVLGYLLLIKALLDDR